MGKTIDRFVLTLAAAGAFYLYYRRAFSNRILAIALALLSCFVLCRLLKGAWTLLSRSSLMRRLRVRRGAGGAVMRLACIPFEEARAPLEALLRKSYDGEYSVDLIQAHPSTELAQDRLFEMWKAHRGESRLAVCVTCACMPPCRALAASLKEPRVAVIDSRLLAQLIAESPENFPSPKATARRPGLRLRCAAALLFNRRNAPRCLALAGAMLVLYLFSANLFYLIFSMLLIFLALVSIRGAGRPARLF